MRDDERPGAWAWLSQDIVQLVTQDLAELTSLGKVFQVCLWLLPEGGQGSAGSCPDLLQAPTAYEERTKVEKERKGRGTAGDEDSRWTPGRAAPHRGFIRVHTCCLCYQHKEDGFIPTSQPRKLSTEDIGLRSLGCFRAGLMTPKLTYFEVTASALLASGQSLSTLITAKGTCHRAPLY